MTCKIVMTTRTCTELPGYGRLGSSDMPLETVAHCETHNMKLDEPCSMGTLCPVGKIEHATEMALERIKLMSMAQFPNPDGDHGC